MGQLAQDKGTAILLKKFGHVMVGGSHLKAGDELKKAAAGKTSRFQRCERARPTT